MAGPGDDRTAGAGSRGHLRASREDRERVIELLKDAFVQERLTQGELDTRVGQALASRTHADLADLTADIPAGPATAEPAAAPARTPTRTLAKAARRSGTCMLVAFALVGVLVLTHSESMAAVAFFAGIAAVIAASGFLGYGVVDAWQERGSRGQLPPRPPRDGGELKGGRPASTGRGPAPHGARADRTRADRTHVDRTHVDRTRVDLRSGRPGRDRRAGFPAPRGVWPVPGAG